MYLASLLLRIARGDPSIIIITSGDVALMRAGCFVSLLLNSSAYLLP